MSKLVLQSPRYYAVAAAAALTSVGGITYGLASALMNPDAPGMTIPAEIALFIGSPLLPITALALWHDHAPYSPAWQETPRKEKAAPPARSAKPAKADNPARSKMLATLLGVLLFDIFMIALPFWLNASYYSQSPIPIDGSEAAMRHGDLMLTAILFAVFIVPASGYYLAGAAQAAMQQAVDQPTGDLQMVATQNGDRDARPAGEAEIHNALTGRPSQGGHRFED